MERALDAEELEQEEEEAFDSSSQGSSTQTSTLTWINWYTSLPGHDFFCDVHEEFIEDDFNLTGLQSMVPFWKEALEMVLDVEPEEDTNKIPDVSIVESSAELLYGLVHQRFILTKAGLGCMVEKYEQGQFGACPRVFCHATHVLPCGRADMPGIDTVKLYCPNCGDIYMPPSSKYSSVDGAFFGSTFAPLFFQTYPELLSAPFFAQPSSSTTSSLTPSHSDATSTATRDRDRFSPSPSPSPRIGGETFINPNPHGGQKAALGRVYTPRIYGFKVSERARSGPRMRWLRERPERWEELDQVDWRGRWKASTAGGGGQDLRSVEDDVLLGGGMGGPGAGGGGKKGALFDDEDEVDDEEDEEEEEEEVVKGGGGTAGGGNKPAALGGGGAQGTPQVKVTTPSGASGSPSVAKGTGASPRGTGKR